MAPRIAIAVVCAAVAAAVLVGGGGSPAPPAAVARSSPPVLAFTAQARSSPVPEVFALHSNGTVAALTSGPAARVVSWSPDGRDLLVIRPTGDVGGGEKLVALDTVTGRTRPLWRATTMEDAAWSPDGTYIAVEWDGKVSILRRDCGVVRALGEQVPPGRAGVGGLAWSADGGRLAVVYATHGGSGIAIEQPHGVLPRIMSPCGRERPCDDVMAPDWAPGSDALVMVRGHGAEGRLWWWTGRGPPQALPATGLPDSVQSARWAPDGHRLAVATADGIYLMEGPGARASRITTTAPLAGPAWSADGRLLAIVTRSAGGGPDVLDVLAPGAEGGPARLHTSSVFDRISGSLIWNPAGDPAPG